MILKAISDYKDPRIFEEFRHRYNQEDVMSMVEHGSPLRHGYDQRFGVGRWMYCKSFRRPEDEDGLVGYQEVSHY